MPGFTIKIDTSQGKKVLEDIKRSTDSFGNSLKVTPRTADSSTLSLVKLAKQVTALVGAYLSLNKATEILGRGACSLAASVVPLLCRQLAMRYPFMR